MLDNQTRSAVLAELAKMVQMPDPLGGAFGKSTFSQSGSATSGLTYYDLEAGAKLLYPVLTPLRNTIPRVSGKGGIQANWRAITAVNTTNISAGVAQGQRNAVMAITTQDYTAAYKGIGMESSLTFEAQYAGQGFDDIRSLAGLTGLQSLMLGEELYLLGGDNSVQLGTTPTPSTTPATTGGALAAATYDVHAVALTLEGYQNDTVDGGIQTEVTRLNADGTTATYGGGAARISAAASAIVGGSGAGSIVATVTAVRGAVAYGWFWGVNGGGQVKLGAITTVPKVTITATATGTQLASDMPATDYSTNSYAFDGLLTQAFKSGSNAYWNDLAADQLTPDGEGGIVEIDTALLSFWNNYRLSPDTIWVNAQQALNISQIILTGTTTSNLRYTTEIKNGLIAGGVMVQEYLNRFSMGGPSSLAVKIHPNLPPGTILFTTSQLPYPLSNVSNVMQVRTRQDYYQIEWPLRTRQYEYGVYADEVLQHYFPPSLGLITGIAAGIGS